MLIVFYYSIFRRFWVTFADSAAKVNQVNQIGKEIFKKMQKNAPDQFECKITAFF